MITFFTGSVSALTTKKRARPTPWLHSTVSYRGDSLRNHLCLLHCYRRGYFGKKIISWDAREKGFGGRGGMCVGVSGNFLNGIDVFVYYG